MYDVFNTVENWVAQGRKLAMATVISTWGSAPRPVGSVLLVSENGDMAGSVSGGCVENAVVREALQALKTGVARRSHYGISNDDAWAVGLMCGGELDVLATPFPTGETLKALRAALRENRGGVLLNRLDAPNAEQYFFPADTKWDSPYDSIAQKAWRERQSQIIETLEGTWFALVIPRKAQLLVIGAAHVAAELVRLAKWLDFETIVIDPRQVFTEQTVFPEAPHQMIVDWPAEALPRFQLDAFTYVVLLTHDPRIDDQALHILLHSEAGYIGALGSRRTHEQRIARLRSIGFDEADIARIHAPVGLGIGAKGAKEIALSIVAEIIQVKNRVTVKN